MNAKTIFLLMVFLTLFMVGITVVHADCCVVLDNGGGTANLPPEGCSYQGQKKIIDGLPPGTTIDINETLWQFSNIERYPGVPLGGEVVNFSATEEMDMTGTGGLAGYKRTLTIPNVQCQTHSGPRNPGDPVQSFPTDFFMLQGQLPPGDPDFDLLRITAGTGFGMPSPGHTTLTRLPVGSWAVDSFFDITYRIDFIGAPGGPLSGMSGSTTATIRMSTCVTESGAGENCFEVECGQSHYDFNQSPIPADFFAPGSEPFSGVIRLGGANLDAPDTLIRRLADPFLPDPLPATDTVPIEIVALNLVSCEPITVRFPEETQWDVEVDLSQIPAPPGQMTVTKTHPNGGTFTSILPVQAKFTFTEVGNPGNVRVLDTGQEGWPPVQLQSTEPYPWQDTSPKPNPPCDGNAFYPGIEDEPLVACSPSGELILELWTPLPPSPYFALGTAEHWQGALERGRVRALLSPEWLDYMQQWQLYIQEGNDYPPNNFLEPNLYVWPGNECICPNDPYPSTAGLVMAWGEPTTPDGSYSSAWRYQYPEDPDLSNVTITVTVFPPCNINTVSFGMQDINGNIRAWHWSVAAAAGPGTLQCGIPTTININTALTGVGATAPAAAAYMNNPGFDITQVQSLLFDENCAWVAAVGVPPPGTLLPDPWNYWRDLIVTPNPPVKPTDPVKWSQPPVKCCGSQAFLGWDELSVYDHPPLLADDWLCTDKRPVTDIHWWGSFIGWLKPTKPPQMPMAFHIGIWTDVPKGPNNCKSFSHPGQMVWEHICTNYQWNFVGYDKDPRKPSSVVDPAGTVLQPAIHDSCFQFNCQLPQNEWFYQEPGPCGKNIYWLSIAAIYNPNQIEPFYRWGWKTRPHFFNDDAVRIFALDPNTGITWPPNVGSRWGSGEPIEFPRCISWDLAFELTTNKECGLGLSADLDDNGIVNFGDMAILAEQWLLTWP